MVAVLFGQFFKPPQTRYAWVTLFVFTICRLFQLMRRGLNPEIFQIYMGGEGGRPQVGYAGEIYL